MAHSRTYLDKLGIGLLMCLAVLFVALGRWQLSRAETNRAIESAFAAADDLPVLEPPLPSQAVDTHRYRHVRLDGRYEAGVQVLLDNMTFEGVAGYEVLTPLRLHSGQLVLVNRGWLPAGPDRNTLPDVAIENRPVVVEGRIDRLPRAALQLGSSLPSERADVVRLSFPDIATVETVLDRNVEPLQVLLDASYPDGFAREWTPDLDRDERNVAYAVQWFGLAILAFALGIGSIIRRRRAR